MRRFFISPEQLSCKLPQLTGPDAHHLRSVLRLKQGDQIVVFDGRGHEYRARITIIEPDKVTLSLLAPIQVDAESPLSITLAQGFLKDKKMDRLVRPLTELGIACWMPFRARRSVSIPDEKRMKARCQRWHKLSQEALKQCGRSRVMTIAPENSLGAVMAHARDDDLKIIFYEGAVSISLGQIAHHQPQRVFILVGPEGGFTPEEVAEAQAQGFSVAGMGPRILRAETAALAASALVQYHFGDLG